jgi:hypothetical protein
VQGGEERVEGVEELGHCRDEDGKISFNVGCMGEKVRGR